MKNPLDELLEDIEYGFVDYPNTRGGVDTSGTVGEIRSGILPAPLIETDDAAIRPGRVEIPVSQGKFVVEPRNEETHSYFVSSARVVDSDTPGGAE
ncbi:hypothetical protein GII30_20525 [Gordonia amarae]|uniref:Uncharacterized protein n=2 Tax=Gordonia amarae TaxID=36821 RepID=G7GSW8_9ACTN|nr:hypothetical protein [Gordonia amarae]MCS3880835.1 hypothetical protein [Gordonia amarae]QHN32485.1 hypothetical protein GII32_20690 [Gordonia amarae]QHN41233.1 hypothetical protein GII30_20525 [Gordonia amarae]GAB06693.1 hypothetical protein GOAMR_58_00690 [Gordonia amarae NBRC 15530]